MVRTAGARGLDALVISDHDRLAPQDTLAYLNAKYTPFRVFGGVEVTTDGEHILVLGIDDPVLEQRWWTYRDLHAFVEQRNGFMAVAHPFRFNPCAIGADVDRYPPNALEAWSQNTPTSARPRIAQLARELDLPQLSNSDAHHAGDIGSYYNELENDARDSQELIAMLKAGSFKLVAPDPVGAS